MTKPTDDTNSGEAQRDAGNAPKKGKPSKAKGPRGKHAYSVAQVAKYPRQALDRVLRIPLAILDQNAGKDCSEQDSAKFVSASWAGPYQVEISSAIKYGLLERPSAGRVRVTDLARKILRPKNPSDRVNGLRAAVLNAPVFTDVYKHYRGEYLPDAEFFANTLVDSFKVPREKVSEFTQLFTETLKQAGLLEESNGKAKVLDVSQEDGGDAADSSRIKKLTRDVKIEPTDSCFVMMPFAPPLGDYFSKIYEPAIKKAGLRPVRADAEIFGTGKIMDQVWSGINAAKVLVAELTNRNPNVFYELGLAHALKKPVVLVSSNEDDVPFDLKHIRVIYYDVTDPFWGNKLLEKVAENILSAIRNPEEAVFARAVTIP
jgi:hypothetical protein